MIENIYVVLNVLANKLNLKSICALDFRNDILIY
jgi:hypothetical protein